MRTRVNYNQCLKVEYSLVYCQAIKLVQKLDSEGMLTACEEPEATWLLHQQSTIADQYISLDSGRSGIACTHDAENEQKRGTILLRGRTVTVTLLQTFMFLSC